MEVRVDVVHPDAPDVANRRVQEQEAPARVQPVDKGEGNAFRQLQREKRDPAQEAQEQQRLDPGAVEQLIEETQSYLENLNVRLNVEVDKESEEVVVRVLDKETDEVVRQIPPDDVIRLREKLVELRGVLFDEKV